ncbi:ATP-binding protein [Polaribacter sp.]|uniref:ATP-binding protein n=1 Tax=Polaribacter sp. TaxID=1920175 RepID=UPI004047B810
MDKQFIPVIGKDVIESLTIGMYEDSRFIFREYIQNSADQIDKAIREDLIKANEGEIYININTDKRIITIEDNATGIAQSQVQPILQNIAQSTKQRGVDKGFRGIGRLGGLAYCNKLIFETSFNGEAIKSRLVWDAAQLKDIINNRGDKEDAISVIRKVTTFETFQESENAHYFKVILEDVTNDDLLDRKEIEKYLGMVAPLPFPTRFIYKSEILNELKNDNFNLDNYRIYLNSEQIFKGYSTIIYKGEENDKKKEDEVIDIVFFKELASDGKLLFWGWHSVSEKNQSLNQINHTRGFRLRKSNIQIGDEYTLLKLQRDRRFHFYFFGEIHGAHPDLIPNSRRDYFIENDIYFEFEKKLKNYFHTHIYKLCYTASEINSSVKKIEELKTFEVEYKKKQSEGFTDKKEHENYIERFDKKKEDAQKAKKRIEKIELDASTNSLIPVQKILNRITQPLISTEIEVMESKVDEAYEKPKFRTDNLSRLTKDQRKFVSRIFVTIKNVLPKDTAENLIQKIEEDLK